MIMKKYRSFKIMPQLSQRAHNVPASPIRKLVPYAVAAESRGVHVYHLNIGQPDIGTPKAFMQAIRDWKGEVIEYEHSQGTASLIESFRMYYERLGFKLSGDQIQITTGGSEALLFALASVAEPGDRVIVFEPYYTNYAGFAAQLGVELVPVTTRADSGYHMPSRKEVEAVIDKRVRAILFCNPNNPTGTVLREDEVHMLSDLAIRHDLFLISDEVYREFCYSGKHFSVLGIPALEPHAIVVDSVSKRLSACGARVGALVSRNAEVMAASLRMAQARLSSPSLEMMGAEAALNSPDLPAFIETTIAEYQRRRDIVLEGLKKIPGTFCKTPEGAFYLMAQLPVENAEDFARWMLTDFQRDQRTVMVAPGAGFYTTPGLGLKEVRIAYVLNTRDLEDAMNLLGEAVHMYQGEMKRT